jgi:predicted thioesterase
VPPTETDDRTEGRDPDEALAAFRERRRPAWLEPGATEALDVPVTPDLTAEHVGSGDLAVLASPAIVLLVEGVAAAMAGRGLPHTLTTVGVSFELAHEAPTPVGAVVRLSVSLDPGDGRRLSFAFTVNDGMGDVAHGSHHRVLVEREPFMAKAEA